MFEKVITAEKYAEDREKTDEVWSDFEVFSESRDQYPVRELVLQAVEGEFTHPSGDSTIHTLEDSVTGLASDYVYDAVPDELPDDVEQKFEREVQQTVIEYAKQLYVETRTDVEEHDDSISTLQSFLERKADELNIPEQK